jgi:hypothetical protein
MSNELCFGFLFQGECVVLRDRKLNIAPAIKKQVSYISTNINYLKTFGCKNILKILKILMKKIRTVSPHQSSSSEAILKYW